MFFRDRFDILDFVYCPICRNKESRVIDSRLAQDGMAVRRRRECDRCDYRFSTREEMELLDYTVVKRDGSHESFRREKIEAGIRRSLAKRPYTQEQFDQLVYHIERDIQKMKKHEIRSSDIGEVVMKHLSRFDAVAYIRFASIYRSFQDVRTFEHEIRSLEHPGGKRKKKR